MTTFFIILLVLACAVLSLIILVQNPKGGGLAGNIAGFSNQFMGVKQTTDVLEKGTWIFATVIGVLCITSSLFIGSPKSSNNGNILNNINTNNTAPAQQKRSPITIPQQPGKK